MADPGSNARNRPMAAAGSFFGQGLALVRKARARLASVYHNPAYLGCTLTPDTYAGARAYAFVSKVLNPLEWRARQKARKLLGAPIERMERSQGYLRLNWGHRPEVQACVEHCLATAKGIDFSKIESVKAFLIARDLDVNDERVRRLVTFPPLLAIISDYLGSFPIVQSCQFWYSPNLHMERGRSQEYHLDGEDIRQVKVFVPLEEVTSDHGPLTILPAAESRQVYHALRREGLTKKRNRKFPDDIIYRYSRVRGIEMTGSPGTLALVDTCNCYHFGSRPTPKPRLLLYVHYTTAFSREMPLWGRATTDLLSGALAHPVMSRMRGKPAPAYD